MLKLGLSLLFGKGFKASKCKTMAKLVMARIKLLRNKREATVKQMRRDIALLIQSQQDSTARIRVEHVMREQNIMAANEIIELFCELIVARLSIIGKQRECPADLKEGISSLIFAAPRCSDIPELLQMRTIFEKKYGKEFVNAATELRPECGVNRTLIEKLSVRPPTGEVKLKLMKEIAKEFHIVWDHTETEKELLKPREELIEGPHRFVSATSMPVKPLPSQGGETYQSSNRLSNDRPNTMNFENTAAAAKVASESAQRAVAAAQAAAYLANRDTHQLPQTISFSYGADGLGNSLSGKKYVLEDFTSLSLSNDLPLNSQDRVQQRDSTGKKYESHSYDRSGTPGLILSSDSVSNSQVRVQHHKSPGRTYESHSYARSHSTGLSMSSDSPLNSQERLHHPASPGRTYESQRFSRSQYLGNEDSKRSHRRHSYNNTPAVNSDIKFDESDGSDSEYDEEIEMEKPQGEIRPPPDRPPPQLPAYQPVDKSATDNSSYQPVDKSATDNSSSYRRNSLPRVHPRLPDYDELSSRFDALKSRKS